MKFKQFISRVRHHDKHRPSEGSLAHEGWERITDYIQDLKHQLEDVMNKQKNSDHPVHILEGKKRHTITVDHLVVDLIQTNNGVRVRYDTRDNRHHQADPREERWDVHSAPDHPKTPQFWLVSTTPSEFPPHKDAHNATPWERVQTSPTIVPELTTNELFEFVLDYFNDTLE